MDTFSNAFTRTVDRFAQLPAPWSRWARSWAFGRTVKFAGTAGVDFAEVNATRVVCKLRNKRRNQNHIGSLHAAAMALLAETASGFALAMHLPDDKLPLLKSMQVNYLKRSRGDMVATAHLSAEQITEVRTQPRGELRVAVSVTDQTGEAPIACEMLWAWVPRKKTESGS